MADEWAESLADEALGPWVSSRFGVHGLNSRITSSDVHLARISPRHWDALMAGASVYRSSPTLDPAGARAEAKRLRSVDRRFKIRGAPEPFYPLYELKEVPPSPSTPTISKKLRGSPRLDAKAFLGGGFTGAAATAIQATEQYFAHQVEIVNTPQSERSRSVSETEVRLALRAQVAWVKALESKPQSRSVFLAAKYSSDLINDKKSRVGSVWYWNRWLGLSDTAHAVFGLSTCDLFLREGIPVGRYCDESVLRSRSVVG